MIDDSSNDDIWPYRVPHMGWISSFPWHLRSLRAEPEMRVSAWVIYWQVLMREAEWKKRGRTRLSVGGSHAGGMILALDYQPDPGGCSGAWSVPLSWPHLEARGTVFTPPKSWSLTIISPWGGSYQFSSVAQLCLTLCDPMNRSTPGLPVHHQLPEFTQTHIHRVSDAIQPSHPLSSPSPPALNPSQHQSLFQWVNSSHEVAKVLEFQLQHQSFQWTPRTDLLQNGLIGSPCSPKDSQESSPTPQFKSINS